MSCARSTQKFSGKENKNMKRTNGVQAAYDTFLLRVLLVAFRCGAVFNASKEAYQCMAFNCSLPLPFG